MADKVRRSQRTRLTSKRHGFGRFLPGPSGDPRAAKSIRARAQGDITQKQELFCLAFIQTGNASEAYRRAYAASRMAAKTVHECASRVLADRKVSARVAELRAEAAERAKISATQVMSSLARDINFDPARLFHQDGRPKQLHELDEATRLALRGMKLDEAGNITEVKFPEKTAAREQAMKHFGLYERDNKQKPFYTPPQIVVVGVPGRRSDDESLQASRTVPQLVIEGVKGKG